jgi:hypothetical protein
MNWPSECASRRGTLPITIVQAGDGPVNLTERAEWLRSLEMLKPSDEH